jgi:nicotinic acid mononucleotide adenylyltransferase
MGGGGSAPRATLSPSVDKVAKRMRRVFAGLDSRPYLGEDERREFRFYHSLFEEALEVIDHKVREGRLVPIDLTGFPQVLNYPGYVARVGIFIGSFDPFQMTHLGAALRFLASDSCEADLVFVVPEGSENPRKPEKSDYSFRYELLRLQLEGIFSPFVIPLDIGRGADTIGIVERLIALHPGARLRLTHVLGSDSLPTATRFLPEDLAAWRAASALHGVELDHSIHVERRAAEDDIEIYAEAIRALGCRLAVDDGVVKAPASTDFRQARNITIVFPTEAVLSRLELLFRYGMNQAWMSDPGRGGPAGGEPAKSGENEAAHRGCE